MKKKDLEVNPVKIELDLSVDQDKVSSFVSEKCGSAVAGAVDATITRKDGKFEITPSKEGLAVDMDATKAALNEALNSENTDAIRVEASVTVKKPKVTEEDSRRSRMFSEHSPPALRQAVRPVPQTLRWVQERSTDMC